MRKKNIESGVIRFEIPIEESSTTLTLAEIKKLQQFAKKNGLSVRRYVALVLKKHINDEVNKPLKIF